jgi:hypothetical protein
MWGFHFSLTWGFMWLTSENKNRISKGKTIENEISFLDE